MNFLDEIKIHVSKDYFVVVKQPIYAYIYLRYQISPPTNTALSSVEVEKLVIHAIEEDTHTCHYMD